MKMVPSPILSFNHTVSFGIMLNFNGGNNGHGLKTLRVNRPEWFVRYVSFTVDRREKLKHLTHCDISRSTCEHISR